MGSPSMVAVLNERNKISNSKLATRIHRSINRITAVLTHAMLEWILMLLLLCNSLLYCFIKRFANYFGLKPTCLWCIGSIDHMFDEPKNSPGDAYRDIFCEDHSAQISELSYCINHKKLVASKSICSDCSPSGIKYKVHGSTHCFEDVSLRAWMREISSTTDEKLLRCSCCGKSWSDEFCSSREDFIITHGLMEVKQKESVKIEEFVAEDQTHNGEDYSKGTDVKPQSALPDAGSSYLRESPQDNSSMSLFNANEASKIDEEVVVEEDFIQVVFAPRSSCDNTETWICNVNRESLESVSSNPRTACASDKRSKKMPALIMEFGDDVDSGELRDADVDQRDVDVKQFIGDRLPEVREETENEAECVEVVEPGDCSILPEMKEECDKETQFVEIMEADDRSRLPEVQEESEKETKRAEIVEPKDCSRLPKVKEESQKESEFVEIIKAENGGSSISDCCQSSVAILMDNVVLSGGEGQSCSILTGDANSAAFEAADRNNSGHEQDDILSNGHITTAADTKENHASPAANNVLLASEQDRILSDCHLTTTINAEENHTSLAKNVLEGKGLDGIFSNGHISTPTDADEKHTSTANIGMEGHEQDGVLSNGHTAIPTDFEERQTSPFNNVSEGHGLDGVLSNGHITTPTNFEERQTSPVNSVTEGSDQDGILSNGHITIPTNSEERQTSPVNSVTEGSDQNVILSNGHITIPTNSEERQTSPVNNVIEGRDQDGILSNGHITIPTNSEERPTSPVNYVIEGEIDNHRCVVDPYQEIERIRADLELEQKARRDLASELEAERNASSVAASQTMAMITRLQEEKAAIKTEALQYQRMMEEQAEYDQEALQLLNELVIKREKEKEELQEEIEMYREKLLNYEIAKEIRRRSGSSSPCHIVRDRDGVKRHTLASDQNGDVCGEEEVGETDNKDASTGEVLSSVDNVLDRVKNWNMLDGTLEEFEVERTTILQQLKELEEKLYTMCDEDEFEAIKPTEHLSEGEGGEREENSVLCSNEVNLISNGCLVQSKSMAVAAQNLLPLLDEAGEDDSKECVSEKDDDAAKRDRVTEKREIVVRSREGLEEKMVAIVKEMDHVYGRLQALEADREFIRHCVSSLNKGEKGVSLLEEILEHLRELRAEDNCGLLISQ